MQKLKDIHEGHVEKCCFCIAPTLGAKILGWLSIIETVLYVVAAISALTTVGVTGLFVLVGAIFPAYIAHAFFKCFRDESDENKAEYARRFNLITKIAYFFLAIYAIVVLVVFFMSFSFGALIGGLLYCFISFFLLAHYNKTVRTYAEHGDGFKAQ